MNQPASATKRVFICGSALRGQSDYGNNWRDISDYGNWAAYKTMQSSSPCGAIAFTTLLV